jgi:hypothetical protein
VTLNVIARNITLCLFVIGTFISSNLRAAEATAGTKSSRESREEEAQKGFAHVRIIHAPERTIMAESPETSGEAGRGTKVVVIGSIADRSTREILSRVRAQLGKRANRETRVTGDEHYAIVALGDTEKDPCCFSTFLFGKHEATWVLLKGTWISH